MSTTVNIANTPIAPYLGLLNNLEREEKIALVLYLVDSLPGVDVVETEDTVKDEDAFLAEKLKSMSFSPRIEQLFEKRRKAASMVDLNDERTRHILGL